MEYAFKLGAGETPDIVFDLCGQTVQLHLSVPPTFFICVL